MSRQDISKVLEWYASSITNGYPIKFRPLIIGPSGSGKTYTIKQEIKKLEEHTGYVHPFIQIDATSYTAHGWEGTNFEDVIIEQALEYAKQYDTSVESVVEESIIYIDEIDKILMADGHKGSDSSNRSQQFNLLKVLDEDGVIELKQKYGKDYGTVSTNKILFIFSGAFENIFRNNMESSRSIGFDAKPVDFSQAALYDQKLSWNHLLQGGAVPELLNRMNVLIQTKPYTDKQLNSIAATSWDLNFVEKFLGKPVDRKEMIAEAQKSKAGARGLSKYIYQDALRRSK